MSDSPNSEVVRVDADHPDPSTIARAAALVRAGRLVAFPTETVYGLGAHALDAAAVGRIFAAKGRPANNPVIVHVAEEKRARDVVAAWPEAASRLAARFWPGPLTLVLPKGDAIPDAVTAGGPTVAVRVPAHPVALALLRISDVPIAAPSANRSGELSPTRGEHVPRGLADLLLDAGPVPGGLESTVLDLTTSPPRLLRPGLVTPSEIEDIIGPIARQTIVAPSSAPLASPGLLTRHYAPRTPLELAADGGRSRVEALASAGRRVGWLTFDAEPSAAAAATVVLSRDPTACAARLYDALHALDALGLDRLVGALPAEADEWLAVRDRLRRAAS